MAYIDYQTYPLIIELPNYVMGNVTIKQKADILMETWDLASKEVRLIFNILPFEKLPDDTYGLQLDNLPNSMFYARSVTIVASNADFLDVDNNGAVLCHVEDEYINGDLNPALVGKNYMKDYDYYHNIAFNTPIIIAQLITQAVLAAPGTSSPPPETVPTPMQYVFIGQSAPPLLGGFVSHEGANQSEQGALYFSNLSSDYTTDNTAQFEAIVSGSILRIEQISDTSKWQEYMCVAPATVETGLITVSGSVHWNAGTPLDINAPVNILITPPA
jgi:hypothetical protein